MLVFYPNTAAVLYTPWYRCPKMTLFLPETNPQLYLSMTWESVLVCVRSLRARAGEHDTCSGLSSTSVAVRLETHLSATG